MKMTTLKIITLLTALFAGVSPAMAQSRLQTGNERPVHHRIAHARPQRYDAVPHQNSGDCSPVHLHGVWPMCTTGALLKGAAREAVLLRSLSGTTRCAADCS